MIDTDDLPFAELAVLGAVVASGGSAIDDLVITGDDFNDARHGDLFDTMRQMRSQGLQVDQVTLSSKFPNHSPFIFGLTEYAPFSHAASQYADIVASHGMYRRLVGVAAGIHQLSPEMPVHAMLERAQSLVDSAAGAQKIDVKFVRDILPELVTSLDDGGLFHPTPWVALNAAIGGLRPGCVYVVGARPGVGKSVVAAQLAAALSAHGVVAFSSLEMSNIELVGRLVSERLGIYVGKLKDGHMTQRDWDILAARKHEVEALNIAIDDRASVGIAEIRGFVRAAARKGNLAGIVVDYLQLMASTSKNERQVVVSEFSRQMKIMAKDLKVPVILLSQLNRKVEDRLSGKPALSDLRESGSIEQDADAVILLSREKDDFGEHLILDLAKNRHGGTAVIDLEWQGHLSRAIEWGT